MKIKRFFDPLDRYINKTDPLLFELLSSVFVTTWGLWILGSSLYFGERIYRSAAYTIIQGHKIPVHFIWLSPFALGIIQFCGYRLFQTAKKKGIPIACRLWASLSLTIFFSWVAAGFLINAPERTGFPVYSMVSLAEFVLWFRQTQLISFLRKEKNGFDNSSGIDNGLKRPDSRNMECSAKLWP